MLRERIAARARTAGCGADDPLVVGLQRAGAPPVLLTGGQTSTGDALSATSVVSVVGRGCVRARGPAGRPPRRSLVRLNAQLVRVAVEATGFVALDDDEDRADALADVLLEELTP